MKIRNTAEGYRQSVRSRDLFLIGACASCCGEIVSSMLMHTAAYNKTIQRIAENPPVVDVHKKSRSGVTAISITLSTKALVRTAPHSARACRPDYAKAKDPSECGQTCLLAFHARTPKRRARWYAKKNRKTKIRYSNKSTASTSALRPTDLEHICPPFASAISLTPTY